VLRFVKKMPINIKNDIISFEGKTQEEAHQKFIESIDTYLSYCHEFNHEPEKPESVKLDHLS
jgi:predicted HicB family RNase H-like nuclease